MCVPAARVDTHIVSIRMSRTRALALVLEGRKRGLGLSFWAAGRPTVTKRREHVPERAVWVCLAEYCYILRISNRRGQPETAGAYPPPTKGCTLGDSALARACAR